MPTPTPLINPTTFRPAGNFGDIPSILNLITPLISLAATLIFLAMLFYAGFTIITASGQPENIIKAQKIATAAVIGLIIVLLAYLIVKLIGIFLGVQPQMLF